MTNLEHYVENAVCHLENDGTREDFFKQDLLKLGEQQTGISREKMWEIACYIVYTYRQSILGEDLRK